jgi:hypothetical protein
MQVIASIPFALTSPEMLYHVLNTFTPEQIHSLAVQNHVKEGSVKEHTIMQIVDCREHINATLDILG